MAVTNEDLARLVVTLDADVTKMYNGLKRAQQQTNNSASGIEKRLTQMSSNIDRTFSNLGKRMSANLTGPLAGIGAAFSTVEIIRYADAWTVAANKVAAAGDIVGIQARPLSQLRELADQGRSSFEDTIQLYSRMLRAAGGVANGELEIAKATDIVNKAFKAGGAATSEMQAGILQLSQGLSSGILQGDELRSVRENAPVLAQVMADYFKTTIGGLKDLGSQGKLTSDLVFKAILSGEAQIESAFGKTNRTIGESFQLVQNRMIEYIGTADQTVGATATITQALTFLADNFDQTADVVLKLAAVIAGALIGRSILGMISGIGQSLVVLRTLNSVMKEATSSSAKFGSVISAAFGPLALIIGGVAAVAFQELNSQAVEAAANINAVNSRVETLGGATIETAKSIREAAAALEEQTEATKRLAEAERLRNLAQANASEDALRGGSLSDNLRANSPVLATPNSELASAFTIAVRAGRELSAVFTDLSETDRKVISEIKELAVGLEQSTIPAQKAIDRIRELNEEPMSAGVLELLDSLDQVAISLKNVEFIQTVELDSSEIDELNAKLIESLELQSELAFFRQEFGLQEDIENLIDRLKDGEISAVETKDELQRLAGTSATFAGFLGGLGNLINGLVIATQKAAALKAIADSVAGRTSTPGPFYGRGEIARRRTAKAEAQEVTQAYIDGQREYNSLTEEQRDIQEEIARIVKDSGLKQSDFNSEELNKLAAENLARKAADKKSGSSTKSDSQKFFEDLDKEERANEILKEELALRQTLNPLINDYGLALEKAKKEQELLVEAEEAGVALTPEVRDRIAAIAELYATTTAEIEKTTEAQDKLKQTTQEWTDTIKGATRSFIDDLIEGKTAAEAFGNVLQQIGSKLIDFGLDSLFNGGGGLGGGIGGLFGSLFGLPGRAAGGPVSKGQPYIVGEKRPEVFVPSQNGVIIPKVPSGFGNGSSVNAPVSISIDATGADSAGLARLQSELVKVKSEIPYLIKAQVSQRSKKGW